MLAKPNSYLPEPPPREKIGVPRHIPSREGKTASEWRHLWPKVMVLLEDSGRMDFWLPQMQTIKTQNVCSFFSGSTTHPLSPGYGSLRRPASELVSATHELAQQRPGQLMVGKSWDKELRRCIGAKVRPGTHPKVLVFSHSKIGLAACLKIRSLG